MALYSRSSMLEMLEMAKQLGFTDDVAHWTKELKKLDEAEKK